MLIPTGWCRYFMVDNQKYVSAEPGLGEKGARWITDQQVAAIGADTMNDATASLVWPVAVIRQRAVSQA